MTRSEPTKAPTKSAELPTRPGTGGRSRFDIAAKFFGGFGVLLALIAITVLLGLRTGNDASDRAVFAGEQTAELHWAQQAYEGVTTMRELDDRRRGRDGRIWTRRHDARLDAIAAMVRRKLDQLAASAETAAEQAEVRRIRAALGRYLAERDRPLRPDSLVEATSDPAFDALRGEIARNADTHAAEARAGLAESKDAAARDERNLLILGGASLLIGLVVAAILTRQFVPRIRAYSAFASRVATGDLTQRLPVEDQGDELADLGRHLNEMVGALASLSARVQQEAQAINASTSQILAAVSQHTAAANEQSAAIAETSTSIEEIRVAAEQAALKAEEVARQADSSVEVGEEGTLAVEEIADGMDEIQQRVDAIAGDILALSEQTQQIGEITRTVNELADRSNLLAFNATIEAAKAGEQGKGFAVVADEVRNLAEQSKQATAQVQTILGDIQRATNAAVMAAEEGTKTVQSGTERAGRAGEVIAQLAEINREAAQAAQQIAALARQQNAGMDQIAQAMSETNASTNHFVDGARESQSAAEDLDEIARGLDEVAGTYKV